jgi:hypothetical protein
MAEEGLVIGRRRMFESLRGTHVGACARSIAANRHLLVRKSAGLREKN